MPVGHPTARNPTAVLMSDSFVEKPSHCLGHWVKPSEKTRNL